MVSSEISNAKCRKQMNAYGIRIDTDVNCTSIMNINTKHHMRLKKKKKKRIKNKRSMQIQYRRAWNSSFFFFKP